jgi:ABC-2 type transport system permease protein
MSWQAVARKDFQDASRSYLLWGLTGFFAIIVALVSTLLGYFTQDLSSSGVLGAIHLLFQYLVPLIGIAIAHGAIVNEHDTGSLKLLMALPHSRSDVVMGKLLGRSGAFVVPLAVGMLLPAIGMLLAGVTFQGPQFVGYILLTALFGIAFVSLSVGLSAAIESRFRVLLALFGIYFVFDILWFAINRASFVIILMVSGQWPEWMPLTLRESLDTFRLLSPTGDFDILKAAMFNDALFASQTPQGVPGPNMQLAALAMLLIWIMFPLVAGTFLFEGRDL